jgi:HNH endonuclease
MCLKVCDRFQIIAHHIKTFNAYPKLRLELSNGITFCRGCHKNLHQANKDATDFTKILRDYMPNIAKA